MKHTAPSLSRRPDVPSEPTLRRLPWYLAYVGQLSGRGVEYVSSTQVARALNVDASQIVKDLACLRLKGKTRIGYHVASLEQELRDFLGFGRRHPAVIVGCGSLGSALMADSGLQRYGLEIVAGFDVNPALQGAGPSGVEVLPLERLAPTVAATGAEIGVVTVPAEHAQATATLLVDAGIRALWNFTPFRILTPPDVVIQNISIYAHLAVMYNRLAAAPPPGGRRSPSVGQ